MNPGSIDQDTVSPFDAAHAEDLVRLSDRSEEEKWASKHSMPTRLLGWLFISAALLQFIGIFFSQHVNLGGLVILITGFMVLQGSWSALRFAIFCSFGAVPSLVVLGWEAFQMRPSMIGGTWRSFNDLEFWTLGVCPFVLLLAGFVLGIAALRTRKLRFWTKPVILCATLIGSILLGKAGLALRDWNSARMVNRELTAEIQTARHHVGTSSPSMTSARSIAAAEAAFSPYPRIKEVTWGHSPNSNLSIYFQGRSGSIVTRPRTKDGPRYSTIMRDGTGAWGRLEIEFFPEGESP